MENLTDNYNNPIVEKSGNYELVNDTLTCKSYINLIVGYRSSGTPIRDIIAKFDKIYSQTFCQALIWQE
jgi:hypothetical protein